MAQKNMKSQHSFVTRMNWWRWRNASVRGFIFAFYKLFMRLNYVSLKQAVPTSFTTA